MYFFVAWKDPMETLSLKNLTVASPNDPSNSSTP
jgi:hypothetical protein